MNDARSLIAAFHELNRSTDRTVANFSPSLIGMFGSIGIFDSFLDDIDAAIVAGRAPASLKKRAANLSGTFIPQVAEYNGISSPAEFPVTAEGLRSISADSLANRRTGVVSILAALMVILKQISDMD